MRSLLRISVSLMLLGAIPALAVLGGCRAEAPNALRGDDMKNSGPDMGGSKSPDLLTPDDGTLEPPTFDALTRSTSYLSVPVQGLAKPGSSVIIEGGANGSIAAEVSTDGRFCVDLQLAANRINALSAFTDDNHGKQSATIQFTIEQKGGAPVQQPTQPTAQNAAIGGSGSGDRLYFERATPSAMIDGDETTSYGGRNTWGDYSIMTVRLADRSHITKVKMTPPADCPFTAPFKVYMSNADAPSNPKVQPMAWVEVPVSQSTTQGLVTFSSPVIATHFSVVWDKPFNASGPSEVNCGSWALGPYYAIAELEAWTAPGIAPPPPAAPSCTGGGQ